MINNEFIAFINEFSQRIHDLKRHDCKKAEILEGVAKLAEEVGEFSSATLTSIGCASDRKLKAFDKAELIEEFGDVIITACLLATELDMDINGALAERKKQIEDRWAKAALKESK